MSELYGWTSHDSALWFACEVAVDLTGQAPPRLRPEVATPFAAYPPDVAYLASGPYELMEYRALGDGTYVQDRSFFLAGGVVGLTLSAASAATRAAGNASRRKQAAAAAQPRWLVVETGVLYVANHSFAFRSPHSLRHWPLTELIAVEMVGPRQLHFQGMTAEGQVAAIMVSDWAELVFACWTMRHNPQHPQLRSGGWLPTGWLHRAAECGYPTRMGAQIAAAQTPRAEYTEPPRTGLREIESGDS